MAQTSVNIRMDEELKRQFDAFCSEIGLNMTTAVNIFAKTVVRQQRIPFELSLGLPNARTVEAMREGERIAARGEARFASAEEMFAELGI